MKIGSISGLEYRVRDLDTTVEFYEALGFRVGKRDDNQATCYVNWFWVRFVTDPDAVPAAATTRDAGPILYLKVDDIDDIDDFYGAVVASGLVPSSEPRRQRSGTREFLLDDPDGNILRILREEMRHRT